MEAANDNQHGGLLSMWDGLDLTLLPPTSSEARLRDVKFFFTGEPCIHGHVSPKYTKGGRCVTCSRMSAAKREEGDFLGSFAAARAHMQREIAVSHGARVYTPTRPCAHGHWLRFTASNNCVECADIARDRHRSAVNERRLIREYGIGSADIQTMVHAQGSCCKICGEIFEDSRKLHVDHDHKTGAVRGMLCALCNQGLGLFKDSPEILISASEYLKNAA